MSEEYWDGATWIFNAGIVNDGSNSGNHIYDISPGAGNEFEVLYGQLINKDAAGRNVNVLITDSSATYTFCRLSPYNFTLAAGGRLPFPVIDEVVADGAGRPIRIPVSGSMLLRAQIAAIAVSQDTDYSVALRIRGAIPTVTLTSPADAVETINLNQVI